MLSIPVALTELSYVGKEDFPAFYPTEFKRVQILTPFEKPVQDQHVSMLPSPTHCPSSSCPCTSSFPSLQTSHSLPENALRASESINMHLDHLLNPQGIHCQKIHKESHCVWLPLHHFFLKMFQPQFPQNQNVTWGGLFAFRTTWEFRFSSKAELSKTKLLIHLVSIIEKKYNVFCYTLHM